MTTPEPASPITGETPQPFVRAEVEAFMDENQSRLNGFAKRGVQINGAEIVMLRIRAMCDVLFGNMDSQPRLAFEARLARELRVVIDNTESEINKQMIVQGITPSGLHLPGMNGGSPR